MDATANPNPGTQEIRTRNRMAWEKFANPESDACRYCPHDRYDHFGQSADGELTRLFCLACAEDLGASQVMCYKRASVGG